ncbi:putative membrane protein [Pseudobacteriovorax antillogorgiicola]|uniref:Putative membrane protein n=1 Tax=Pseudobacteriovorax antillogorgiicola TaxID=1513793 RepID=A0A1Y6BW59_9BACT|nr:putative membrane protein [Pseudobacteriovorax antillogorgiicola]
MEVVALTVMGLRQIGNTMEIPHWAQSRIDKVGKKQVERAVALAEENSAAEIIPMLVRRSSHVSHIQSHLTGFLACSSLIVGLCFEALQVLDFNLFMASGLVILSSFLGMVAARFPLVQRMLIPKVDRSHQVDLRAELEFYEAGLDKGEGRAGVLIFISLLEQRTVILVDSVLSREVPSETWREMVQQLSSSIGRGQMAAGLSQTVEALGKILSNSFPRSLDDRSDLFDTLIIKD